MGGIQRIVVISVLVVTFFSPRESLALNKPAKIFVLTSTYGVMAGALTGVASLAFTSSPRQHLRNIAIGSSAGLYVGLLLGAYMIWGVPDPASVKASEEKATKANPDNPLNLPIGEGAKYEIEAPSLQPLLAYDPQTQTGVLGIAYRF